MAVFSFLRNPVVAKVIGAIAVLAFVLPLVRYTGSLSLLVYAAIALVLVVLARRYFIRRKKELTRAEKRYLKDRFYEH